MIITKTQQVAKAHRKTFIQPRLKNELHFEKVLVTTVRFLFIPIYQSIKVLDSNM